MLRVVVTNQSKLRLVKTSDQILVQRRLLLDLVQKPGFLEAETTGLWQGMNPSSPLLRQPILAVQIFAGKICIALVIKLDI